MNIEGTRAMKLMVLILISYTVSFNAHAWPFNKSGERYREYCLLDNFSKANNDIAAKAVRRTMCLDLPSITEVTPSRSDFRSYNNHSECVIKYASSTSSTFAARNINGLCSVLVRKINNRDCALILDEVISNQPNSSGFRREGVHNWFIENPEHRPRNFNRYCL